MKILNLLYCTCIVAGVIMAFVVILITLAVPNRSEEMYESTEDPFA